MSESYEDRPRHLDRAIVGAGGPRPAGEGVLRRDGYPLTLLPEERCPQPKRLSVPLYPNLAGTGG